jgi:hypothetical protein
MELCAVMRSSPNCRYFDFAALSLKMTMWWFKEDGRQRARSSPPRAERFVQESP